MLASLVALALSQAAAAAPAPEPTSQWNVADSAEGCAVHAADRGGTVLSMFVLPDQEGIGFLLQNRSWTSLEDGGIYPISISFPGGSDWPLRALARTDIDADGPGLFFVVSPDVDSGGAAFMSEFADARGIEISHGGARIDRLSLTGTRGATVALAQCAGRMWSDPAERSPFEGMEGVGPARRI